MKRNRTERSNRGFSLIEVTMTIGVVTFALVGLMGILPVALEHTRTCVNETRAAHLARMIFSTLQSEPYTSVACFSPDDDGSTEPIDLSTLDNSSPAIELYATYKLRTEKNTDENDTNQDGTPSLEEVRIIRTSSQPRNSEYKLELKVDPVAFPTDGNPTPAGPVKGPAARGQNLRLKITQVGNNKVVFEGVQFVGRLLRGVQPQ